MVIIFMIALIAVIYITLQDSKVTGHSVESEKWRNTLTQLLTFLTLFGSLSFMPKLPILDQLAAALGIVLQNFDEGWQYFVWFSNVAIAIWSAFQTNSKATLGAILSGRFKASVQAHSAKYESVKDFALHAK